MDSSEALAKLTPRQRHFVQNYIELQNGTEAAKKAGYAPKSAHNKASRLLKEARIRNALEAVEAERRRTATVTRDWLIERLQDNYQLALEGNPVLDRYGNPTGKYVKQLAAANKALDQMAELQGLKVDKKQVTVREVKDMTEEELAAEERKLAAEIERMKATQH